MSDRTWKSGLPSEYAEEKLERLKRRWAGELGEHLRAMTPVAWPGVPPTVFLGFTSFAKSTENTTEGNPSMRFHELGYFQVEAGLRDGPAPNPDPKSEYNNWGELAGSELVVRLLGRPATMKHNAWREAIADQTAVGLANLRAALVKGNRRIPEAIRAKEAGSTWAVLIAFTTFSRGQGQFEKVVEPYADELAAVGEAQRWGAWESLVAEDIRKGTRGIGSKEGRSGAAYAIVRTRQKHDSGLYAARALGLPTDWYVAPDAARDEVIAKCAYDG